MNENITIYTHIPKDEYTESLANSIHLAISNNEGIIEPLNKNYGILFATATINENNVICEKGLKDPCIFRTAEGKFGISAIRIEKDGKEDSESKGKILFWTSDDLIHFEYHGFAAMQDGEYSKFGNTIAISSEESTLIRNYWLPLRHTGTEAPQNVKVSSPEQLKSVKALAIYSDDSKAEKTVEWDYSKIDFNKPGIYEIKGTLTQPVYQFPLAKGYADPVILPWQGKYYFISSNDNTDDVGLFTRVSDTIEGLFAPGYKEFLILEKNEEKDLVQTFWAPEFHFIGGSLYILFAVSGKKWGPQCHIMRLKENGNICEAKDWEDPVLVRRKNGDPLVRDDGISLDMTYFKAEGASYLAWSYRRGFNTPDAPYDTGSMILIAAADDKNPAVLASDPVLLSRPLFGWENIQGTINNEGPYPLVTDKAVYLAFSGGAANGYTYAIGTLRITIGDDCLNPALWKKSSCPVLSYNSIDGVYGPGHNSFFKDYDGTVMIMYHGETELVKTGQRCTAMHRVHFDKNGEPVFNLSIDRDSDPALSEVSMQVTVRN